MSLQVLLVISAALVLATGAGAAVNVRDHGAKGDGSADDSAAIQKAMDAASASGGGIVELGVGRFRLDKPLNVPEGVTLLGVWEAPHHAQLKKGTVLEIYAGKNDENGAPAVMLNPSSAIKGITFFYPEQRLPAIPYSWTVRGTGMHCSIMDCTFVNPYRMIDFATNWNELHYIRNVFGSPLKIGISIDKCSDIGRIENVHFNPHYWFRAETESKPDGNALIRYLGENLVAFEFARTDWEYVFNTFCFGAKIGYRFYGTKDGTVNGNFLGIGADWCDRAVLVEQSQPPGLLITNGEFVCRPGAGAIVEVKETNGGPVQLCNCAFWGPGEIAALTAGRGTVTFNNCNFQNAATQRTGNHTLEVKSGEVIVQGCRFAVDRPDIVLDAAVKAATIFGNRFQSSKEITNSSEGDVQEGLNVVSR